ncbi:MAG: hypothetical protein LBG13_01185 [Holosporales bacterium]|nr:hypothetical protein [Holosporales bacterium]
MGQRWDKNFSCIKIKKCVTNIIDTCSCGLSFPGDCAGLTRRILVYVRETMRKVSRNRPRRRLPIDFTSPNPAPKNNQQNQPKIKVLLTFWSSVFEILYSVLLICRSKIVQILKNFFKRCPRIILP